MNVAFSQRFVRQYAALSPQHKAKFNKQLGFLVRNLRHSSLRAKKYDEAQDVWQARVDENYRFYFTIEGDTYRMLSIMAHPK
jgi:mRNA-degrading endonuclease RelE of RelBE toxin-antitoxin system